MELEHFFGGGSVWDYLLLKNYVLKCFHGVHCLLYLPRHGSQDPLWPRPCYLSSLIFGHVWLASMCSVPPPKKFTKSLHEPHCINFQAEVTIWGRTPPKAECIYKKLCIYSYVFKPQSPSKYSPFDAIHLLRCFSPAQNSFWTHQFWGILVLLPLFVLSPPHWQTVSRWGLFHLGNKQNKKSFITRSGE